MILIHAGFFVDPLKEQNFLEEIASLIQASRQEAGNISYQLYKDTEKEHAFTMVEVWEDSAAVASHNSSEHFTSFSAKAGLFLTAPLDIKIYDGQRLK
ncbi:quinol monooxygenase YgiN [Fontibacillus solani]|uniref:Quinol monooxygenase YgiN n=2 Tax=Fontibacillus TaxID=995014 RepID=A0A1G7MH06_9BACL|nr:MULTISPECIES: putative quinol monooxygenase [Fontibacillus]MBA9084647.1 quinol monooxygenase YgiN [Fontibacillus solani]SDF60409.1 Quinol monooxygenase YgiN [Fontibacillus panacisegetis]